MEADLQVTMQARGGLEIPITAIATPGTASGHKCPHRTGLTSLSELERLSQAHLLSFTGFRRAAGIAPSEQLFINGRHLGHPLTLLPNCSANKQVSNSWTVLFFSTQLDPPILQYQASPSPGLSPALMWPESQAVCTEGTHLQPSWA